MGLVSRALACMRIVLLNVLLAVVLLLDPALVKADDTLLKLLVVSDMLDYLEDIVLESLLLKLLHVQLVTAVQVFVFETLVAHLKVIDDEV